MSCDHRENSRLVCLGDAEQAGDEARGHGQREVGHEVDDVGVAEGLDVLAHEALRRRLGDRQHARAEAAHDGPAQAAVLGRVGDRDDLHRVVRAQARQLDAELALQALGDAELVARRWRTASGP